MVKSRELNIFQEADRLFDNVFLGKHPFWEFPYVEPAGYPFYNLIQNNSDYIIEIAVAGFSKDDIKVHIKDDTLYVEGYIEQKEKEGNVYLKKGISRKSFTRTWKLAKNIILREAALKDGILTISLYESKKEEVDNYIEIK